MYYVYVLLSLKDQDFYVGKTSNLEERLELHHSGRVPSTSDRRPLRFLYAEMTPTEADAGCREIYLKTSWGKRYLRTRLENIIHDIMNERPI